MSIYIYISIISIIMILNFINIAYWLIDMILYIEYCGIFSLCIKAWSPQAPKVNFIVGCCHCSPGARVSALAVAGWAYVLLQRILLNRGGVGHWTLDIIKNGYPMEIQWISNGLVTLVGFKYQTWWLKRIYIMECNGHTLRYLDASCLKIICKWAILHSHVKLRDGIWICIGPGSWNVLTSCWYCKAATVLEHRHAETFVVAWLLCERLSAFRSYWTTGMQTVWGTLRELGWCCCLGHWGLRWHYLRLGLNCSVLPLKCVF